MKKTLLEIVQGILSSLNYDPAGSIYDSPEALQVASCVQTTYYQWMTSRDWPHLREYGPLENYTDGDRPTLLIIPDQVSRIEWLTYDKRKPNETRARYAPVTYLFPDEFVEKLNGRNEDQPHYERRMVSDKFSLLIRNDRAPSYWTSFDDKIVVMDSYDNQLETTLRAERTQSLLYKQPLWVWDDGWVPDVPVEVFPGFEADAKALAFFEINEISHSKAEMAAHRVRVRSSNQAWVTHDGFRETDYGRKGPGRSGRSRLNRLLEK